MAGLDGEIQAIGASARISNVDDAFYDYGDGIRLSPNADDGGQEENLYAPNNPYLMIRTDETFVADHNDIYGEELTNFVRRFYIRHINGRQEFEPRCWDTPHCGDSTVIPCRRSCTRADGATCTPRAELAAE